MDKGNEEILKKAEVKDFSGVIYDEKRIEYTLIKLLAMDPLIQILMDAGYRLNNIIIPGYKDIGLQGQAIFILREFPWKNEKL